MNDENNKSWDHLQRLREVAYYLPKKGQKWPKYVCDLLRIITYAILQSSIAAQSILVHGRWTTRFSCRETIEGKERKQRVSLVALMYAMLIHVDTIWYNDYRMITNKHLLSLFSWILSSVCMHIWGVHAFGVAMAEFQIESNWCIEDDRITLFHIYFTLIGRGFWLQIPEAAPLPLLDWEDLL